MYIILTKLCNVQKVKRQCVSDACLAISGNIPSNFFALRQLACLVISTIRDLCLT